MVALGEDRRCNGCCTRSGPLAIGINQGGMFTRALPRIGDARHAVPFRARCRPKWPARKPHPFPGFTFSVCQLRPTSRGHVRIKSADPLAAPAMQPNYLTTELDQRCAIAAVRYARRLAAHRADARLRRRGSPAGRRDRSANDHDVLEFCRDYGATIFHPSGTCRMGVRDRCDAAAVVDARLRVHGVDGLRVVDCSIMPTLVSGNTNAPVVMIAEKASDMILADAAAQR